MKRKTKAPRVGLPPRTPSTSALLTPEEARIRLRLSRGVMYQAVAANTIKHVRFGKKILIPLVVIEAIERGENPPAAAR